LSQFCLPHWEVLRTKIDEAGLGSLVAESAEEAAKKTAAMTQGLLDIDTFEPLMYAHLCIIQNALEIGAQNILSSNGCPICLLKEVNCPQCNIPHPDIFDDWLNKAVEDTIEVWKSFKEE
jgi:hypothetical protein